VRYHLLACADDFDEVVESDESNNCRASAGKITVVPPRPDLLVSAVSDPLLSRLAGESFTVASTVTNVGTGRAALSTTRFYLSRDDVRDGGDRRLAGDRPVPARSRGELRGGAAGEHPVGYGVVR
jgi:subtilase family serine protease